MNDTPVLKRNRKPAKQTPPRASNPQVLTADSYFPSASAVAYRAYLNFENHGLQDGHDVADWLQAEAELVAEGPMNPAP